MADKSVDVSMGHEQNNGTIVNQPQATEKNTRSNSSDYNNRTMEKQLIHEEWASAVNYHEIAGRIAEGTARDLADEPTVNGEPAFVIGSGPSLDDSIEYLKDWKGGIICTTSHALTLMYHGIEPTHILALDPFSEWDEIKGVDWSDTRTKLILHPGVSPELVARWPNDMILYRQNVGRTDSFYNTTQKRMYTRREGGRNNATFHFLIRTDVTLFASSPPAQIFVADRMGYKTVFLAGVDFGFHSDKDRFTSYTVTREESTLKAGNAPLYIPPAWAKHENPYKPSESDIKTHSGHMTAPVHLYYKKNFISAWRLSLQNLRTTDHGIITEIPYEDIKKVVKKQGKGYRPMTPDMIKRVTETYLASVGAFIVECTRGVAFVESADVEKELPAYMTGLNKRYLCPKCQLQAVANDDKEHTGEPCPQCKEPLVKENPVDIEANMKRFRIRIRDAEKVYPEIV